MTITTVTTTTAGLDGVSCVGGAGGTGSSGSVASATSPGPDPSRTGFGRVLQEQGMSIADAAHTTGVPETDLVKLARGDADGIRFATLAAVCAGLGCTPAQLLPPPANTTSTTQHTPPPARLYYRLSQATRTVTRWCVLAWGYQSPRWAWVSMLASAIAATAFLLVVVSTVNPVDFLVYRYSAADAWAGMNIYQVDTLGPMLGDDGLPFTYTPIAALVLLATTIGSPLGAFLGWSAATAALSVAVLYQLMPISWRERPLPLGLLTIWGLCNIITASHLIFGQINVFLMVLVLFDLTRRTRGARGSSAHKDPSTPSSRWVLPVGVLTGIAAAIKLTPTLFIVHLWVTGQYRAARTSTFTAIGVTLIGFAIYPQPSWHFFTTTLWTLSDRVSLNGFFATSGNQSIHGALAAIGPWTSHLALALSAVIVLAGLAAAATAHRAGRLWAAVLIIGDRKSVV